MRVRTPGDAVVDVVVEAAAAVGGRGTDNDDRSVNADGRDANVNWEQPDDQQLTASDAGAGRGAGRGGHMGARMGRGLYGK